jgi:glucose-6-phosphate isomerase
MLRIAADNLAHTVWTLLSYHSPERDMDNQPYAFGIALPQGRPDRYAKHTTRQLSAMNGQFLDEKAYVGMLQENDPVLYEVYELSRPEVAGELIHGISIVHPGKVGTEFFMTKGHFHTVLDTAEIYYCLQGDGVMVMETLEGNWAVEELHPGRVLYVPPRWAHRSVNTSQSVDLITFFAYPGNAGHDYGTIERQGFRKLVVEHDSKPQIVDNPRWRSPQDKS